MYQKSLFRGSLDLLLVYTEIPGTVQLIQELMDRYNGFIDLEKPANCAIVAKVFEYVGEIEKALGLYEKVLNSYRDLARTNPQTYLTDVAMTLNNLAKLQSDKNDYAGAEQGYREALVIYRDLSKKNPQTYLPSLAMKLNNLAVLQSDKNDYAGAEQGYREALVIYRDLSKTNPQTYLPYVAGTLNNLANLQKAQNDYAGAEQGYRETLGIYRDLAQMNPQTYLPAEAKTLINVGWFYHDAVPDKQKSLDVATEVLRIVWPLTEKIPETKQYAESAKDLLKKWDIDPEEFVEQLHLHE